MIDEEEEKIYLNLGDLQEDINLLEDNEPDKRRKEWRVWRDKINLLFKKYNAIFGETIYRIIK